jgi:hypothetical protein
VTSATQRFRRGATDLGVSFQRAALDLTDRVRAWSQQAPARLQAASAGVRVPPEAWPHVARSLNNLRKARTPRQAVAALETEVERLLTVVTPILVAHPLPVRSPGAARTIVATAGGLAAAGEELEELAAVLSNGAAVPPTLPVIIAANLLALLVEIYVAASLRVHDLRAAGHDPDPAAVAHDVVWAMTGGHTRGDTPVSVQSIVRRVLARWGTSLVPFVGVAYSGWDAQRTVDAVRALPVS